LRVRRGQLLGLMGSWNRAQEEAHKLAASPGCRSWGLWLEGYLQLCRSRYALAAKSFALAEEAATVEQPDIRAKSAFYWTLARGLAGGDKPMNNLGRNARHSSAPSLHLCGLGIDPPRQATLEALQALRRCDIVFCNMAGDAITEFLAPWCRDLRPIDFRDESDHDRCLALVRAELRPGRTVGFATFGHPLVFGPLADALLSLCRQEGIECRVYAAVSTLDHCLATMGLALGGAFRGFQVYEYAAVVTPGFSTNPRLPTILFFPNGLRPADLEQLTDVLRPFYPEEHPAYLFGSKLQEGSARRIALAELRDYSSQLDGRRQLFIPPVGAGRPDPDRGGHGQG